MKTSFVILNYNTEKESIECIQHIQKLKCSEDMSVEIVLVDNDSQLTIENIKRLQNIKIIKSEYNLGYAKGNNLGYQFAKHCLNADFIVILNSDVYIKQRDFLTRIVKWYYTEQYDILGPDILTLQKEHQNPASHVLTSLDQVNKALLFYHIRYIKTYIPFFNKLKNSRYSRKFKEESKKISCPLHGACLVFSPKFISRHEHAFYPETFLYAEEEFLYYFAKKNNEKLVFCPEIKVMHEEDKSIISTVKTEKNRKRFMIKNAVVSLKKLKRIMKDEKNKVC